MRPLALFLLCAVAAGEEAIGVAGRTVEGRLPARTKREDPLVYAVYVPTTLPKEGPAPLILALHAGTGTAQQFTGFLAPLAEANGAIVIGPQGLREVVGADGFWWKGDAADLQAVDRILDHAREAYRVDGGRISVVALADGAELALRWAQAKERGLEGLILLNFLFEGGSLRALQKTKVVLFASRDAKEKKHSLKDHAEKAGQALARAKVPTVVRIVPGSSRSFFHGWESEFRHAYEWFLGKRDWPKELAGAQEGKGR